VCTGKVIDFHVHICKEADWHPWVREYIQEVNPYFYQHFKELMNPDGLERYLKSQNVDYAVILAEDSPLSTGVVPNTYVHDFCDGRKRFIPFASINPTTISDLKKTLDTLVKEKDFRGLKLYPTYQHFYPNQKEIYPLYATAMELGIPVMFHTGSSTYKNAKIKYGDPLHLDEVATDFEELTMIMAHSGRGFWYNRAFFLSRIHTNLYMEISGLPPQNLLHYFPDFEKNAEKILFGSDWPGVKGIRDNIDALSKLPLKEETIHKILYENAEKILKLQNR